MTGADVPQISPEQTSRSGAWRIRDEELPMLASVWLAQGYDSQELRELAGLTRQQGRRFFGSGTIIQPSASELMIMSVSICGLCERKTSLR